MVPGDGRAEVLDLAMLEVGSPSHAVAFARRGADLASQPLKLGEPLERLAAFRTRIDRALRGHERRPSAAEFSRFGQELFRFGVKGEVLRLFGRLPASDVRLQVLCDHPALSALPWEYLQEPGQLPGPSRERSVVRIVPTIGREAPAPRKLGDTVRVLFASADPFDQEPVSWPEVKASIERTFALRMPGRFSIEAIDGASAADLLEAVRTREFDVFHFSGHGEVVDGVGHLLLRDRKSHRSVRLKATDLATLLAHRNLRLAILSACETAFGDFRTEFSVTAATLVKAGIPAVVANQLPVPDATVALFAGALYDHLLQTGDIDRAVNEGRIALAVHLAGARDAVLEWGIPALYRHLHAAQVFKP